MATVQRRIVHKQFNSPIGLYSDTNIKETLDRDLKILSNGAVGIEFENNSKLGNLQNSAVLRMLEEEEATKHRQGLKKVAWPPRSDNSPCRNVAQPQQQQQQQQQQQLPPSHQQQQQQQPQGGGNYQNTPVTQNQNYVNNNSFQQQQHQQQQQQQTQQQAHQYQQQQYQNNSTRYTQSLPRSIERPAQTQSQAQPSYTNRQTNTLPINRPGFLKGSSPSTAAFSGGLSVSPKPVSNTSQYSPSPSTTGFTSTKALSPQPQHHLQQTPQYSSPISSGPLSPPDRINAPGSPRGWAHVDTSTPVYTGYTRQLANQQNNQSSYKEDTSSYSVPSQAESQSQYQPQATQAFRPVSYNQQTPQYQQQQHNQQQHQQQQYQPQHHPQEHQYPQDQQYLQQEQQPYLRQQSPGLITLRNEAPVSQQTAPVYSSQPATARFRGGSSMRGDEKWPPATVRAQSEIENEARRRLALGPTCRPRKSYKDYSQFFAQHTLNSTYPGYRAPPGTQHYATYQ